MNEFNKLVTAIYGKDIQSRDAYSERREAWIAETQAMLRSEGFCEEITIHVKLTMFFFDCYIKNLSPKESVDLFLLKGKNLPGISPDSIYNNLK